VDDFSSLHHVFIETLRKPACLGICQKLIGHIFCPISLYGNLWPSHPMGFPQNYYRELHYIESSQRRS